MAKNEQWKKAGKTLNLSKKQVASGTRVGKAGKATVSRKEAKQATKAVSISDTTWKKASERTGPRAKGGVLVDKDGKAVTGTVKLASGKTATYVRGKRVAAAQPTSKPAAQPKTVSSKNTNTASPTTTAKNANKLRKVKNSERTAEQSPKPDYSKGMSQYRPMTGSQPASIKASINPGATKWGNQVNAQKVRQRTFTSQPKNPNIGDIWVQKYPNGNTIRRRYTAGGWRVA